MYLCPKIGHGKVYERMAGLTKLLRLALLVGWMLPTFITPEQMKLARESMLLNASLALDTCYS